MAAFDTDMNGRCINLLDMELSQTGFALLQDLIILALPVREIFKLELEHNKRLGACVMFGLGVM